MFDLMFTVLAAKYDLESKKEVRSFFNTLRQKFLDWNNVEFKGERFSQLEGEIKKLYKGKFVQFDHVAEKLM